VWRDIGDRLTPGVGASQSSGALPSHISLRPGFPRRVGRKPARAASRVDIVAERYWIETLGCPKNQVDSEKLVGALVAEGLDPAGSPAQADVVVVNTCAFVEAARQESIDTILDLDAARRTGSRLVVTGCLAERYGGELADALPEVDLVAPFGTSLTSGATSRVELGRRRVGAGSENAGHRLPDFDLLNLPRPAASAPWAYVKVA
jgi:ribosomal protein S12 methylthiotransferase